MPERESPPAPVASASATVQSSAAPAAFVAPADLPAGDTYLILKSSGAVHIAPNGVAKSEKVSAVYRNTDGVLYGTTWEKLYRYDKNKWTEAVTYGPKASLGLVLGSDMRLFVGRGPLPLVAALNDELWTGKIQEHMVMSGRKLAMTMGAFDDAGTVWGSGMTSRLYQQDPFASEATEAKWGPVPLLAVATRPGGEVYALTTNAVVVKARNATLPKRIAVPGVAGKADMEVGANGTVVVRPDPNTLIFVSPEGGVATVKQATEGAFGVDGRSRVWNAVGDEVRIITAQGTVTRKKLGKVLSSAAVRITVFDGGADIK